MAVQNHVELLLSLERGAFDVVLGTTESEDIEFKQAPYRLDEPRQKWELAKDVAALANQRGGVIVFGFRTERPANQLLDTATEHRPVPKNLVAWDTYRQTLANWVRPSVEGISGRWFAADQQVDRGVFTLIIPAQSDHSKYFLVSGMVGENGFFPGAVGVPVRRGDAVEWLRPDSIQAMLREALWWRQRGPAIADAPSPGVVQLAVQERIAERLRGVELAAAWQETPFLALHAVPAPPLIRPDDFYSDAGLKGRLAAPNVLRRNGFHIWTGADPEVQPDGSLLCPTNRRLLWLSPDGFFTAAATADEEFLGWYFNQRRPPNEPIIVNPRVAAEYVLEFCRFVQLELKPSSQATWTLWLSIVGFDRQGGLLLAPGLGMGGNQPYFRGMLRDEYEPIQSRADRQVVSGDSSGGDAYRLLVEFYALFAAPPDEIPYVVNGEISEEAIIQPADGP